MRFTKLLLKNIAWVLGVLAALVAGLFAVQGNTMNDLLMTECLPCNIWCVIKIDVLVLTGVLGILFLIVFAPPAITDFIVSIFKYLSSILIHFFRTPHFSNVKFSFSETEKGEILICVKNKEWRYPSVEIEALSGGNLKWIPFQKSDVAKIERRGYKHASFLKSANNEFQIDSKNEQVEKFKAGKHKINVVFYINFGMVRIARTYILDVTYKGKNSISIENIVQHQDMPQSDEAWLLYEAKKI